MKLKKPLIALLFVSLAVFSAYNYLLKNPPISNKIVNTKNFGEIVIAQPIWKSQETALVFVDTQKFPPDKLAHSLASVGIIAAIVDSNKFYSRFIADKNKCASAQSISESINALIKELPSSSEGRLFITGISEGALVPFLNAQSGKINKADNISIGFSVNLPANLVLCTPLTTGYKEKKYLLVSAPDIKTNWRTAWNDNPRGETGVFIKENVIHADTNIAAYNTPLDALLLSELNLKVGKGKNQPPMPTIEMPASNKSDVVTLFYSGDGGWRDLDKTVAEEMVKMNSPVIGVDVLRYFWERKTPEQVTADLSSTMTYYRNNWGVKRFVLAGFSFGADILPVLYNRLSVADQDSVEMLVFLALGTHADFEVHVAGWLGQTTHEIPLDVELAKIAKNKLLCIYGKEEKAKTGTACSSLENSAAIILELPGGHHFDNDYPKLTRLILDNYRQRGIN